MTTGLVWLALLMAAATYPFRALPLLVPWASRLPPIAQTYLGLVGPSVLAALAAVSVMVRVDADHRHSLSMGPEWLAVALCVVVVARWRSLLLGLTLSVALVALLRAIGWATLP